MQIPTRTKQQKRMYETVRNANAWPWGGPVVMTVRSLHCFGQIKQKLRFASDSRGIKTGHKFMTSEVMSPKSILLLYMDEIPSNGFKKKARKDCRTFM